MDQPVYGLLLYQWNVPFPGSGTFMLHPGKIPGVLQVLRQCFHDQACRPIVTFLRLGGGGGN